MGEEQGKSQGNQCWDSAKKRLACHTACQLQSRWGVWISQTFKNKQMSSERTKEKSAARPCVSLPGPQRGSCYTGRTSKSKDSASGWIIRTAAGEKTAENFFLTGKYSDQKTGIFKGKRNTWGKKQGMRGKRKLDKDIGSSARAPEGVRN